VLDGCSVPIILGRKPNPEQGQGEGVHGRRPQAPALPPPCMVHQASTRRSLYFSSRSTSLCSAVVVSPVWLVRITRQGSVVLALDSKSCCATTDVFCLVASAPNHCDLYPKRMIRMCATNDSTAQPVDPPRFLLGAGILAPGVVGVGADAVHTEDAACISVIVAQLFHR
jgi:hypothetical protein